MMVKHRHDGMEYWALPGGGVEEGETPAEAAIRELREECRVDGTILPDFSFAARIRATIGSDSSLTARPSQYEWHTLLIDIGEQDPSMGADPEFPQTGQILADVRWMSLAEIPEQHRAFLWGSGLLFMEDFRLEVLSWGDIISYPKG